MEWHLSTLGNRFLLNEMSVSQATAAVVRAKFAQRELSPRGWLLPADLPTIAALRELPGKVKVQPTARALILSTERDLAPCEGLPEGFEFATPPRTYQREATDRGLRSKFHAFFMGVRTGKTKVIIDIARARLLTGQNIDALVIVCPKSVREVWEEEFRKHAPDISARFIYSGTPLPKGPPLPGTFPVYIQGLGGCSSSKNQKDALVKFLKTHPNSMLVLDEAHRIKTPNTVATKFLLSIRDLALYRYILTGTESDKGLHDLWAQMHFLSQSVFGSPNFYVFRNRYCVMGGFERKNIVGWQNVDEFTARISPHVFRVATSALGVPEVVETVRYVDSTPEIKEAAMVFRDLERAGQIITLTRYLHQQQVVGGWINPANEDNEPPAQARPNPKLDELMDLVEQHKGDKVVIWARFVPEIAAIADRLKAAGLKFVVMTGKTEPADRARARHAFQSGEVDIFLGNQATGGVGLALYSTDLTRQHVAIYYSNTFSYIDRAQSIARTVCQGQIHGTLVYDIYMRGFQVDTELAKAIRNKQDLTQQLAQLTTAPGAV